jgi:hypothetical protein
MGAVVEDHRQGRAEWARMWWVRTKACFDVMDGYGSWIEAVRGARGLLPANMPKVPIPRALVSISTVAAEGVEMVLDMKRREDVAASALILEVLQKKEEKNGPENEPHGDAKHVQQHIGECWCDV